jgi:L-fuconolactonase
LELIGHIALILAKKAARLPNAVFGGLRRLETPFHSTMPSFGIIDTHLHLWDPARISYAWQKGNALFDRRYGIEDYQRDSQGLDVEALVFVECHVDGGPGMGQYIKEIEFVEEEAQRDPRIRAVVAKAPLERGYDVEALLDELVMRFPKLRGIRRIPEFEPDPRAFMLNPKFIEAVRLLPRYDLHFELNVNYTQIDAALEFADQVPKVSIILDHCGKPGVKGGHIELFRRHMKALAAHPNVVCKLSDLPVEANWDSWSEADLRPFIDTTIEAFGIERVMYGGDWPVCLQATSLQRWIACLDRALADLSMQELRKIYRDNANQFYRLGLPLP